MSRNDRLQHQQPLRSATFSAEGGLNRSARVAPGGGPGGLALNVSLGNGSNGHHPFRSTMSPLNSPSILASPSGSSFFPTLQNHRSQTISPATNSYLYSSYPASSSTGQSRSPPSDSYQDQQQQYQTQGMSDTRPLAQRSNTSGPLDLPASFAEERITSRLSAPSDLLASPSSQQTHSDFDAPLGFGPPRRSRTAGPSLWTNDDSGIPSTTSSHGAAADLWNKPSALKDRSLLNGLRTPTRGNSSSSDSGIWQNNTVSIGWSRPSMGSRPFQQKS